MDVSSKTANLRDMKRRLRATYVAIALYIVSGIFWFTSFALSGKAVEAGFTALSLSPYLIVIPLLIVGKHLIARMMWLIYMSVFFFVMALIAPPSANPGLHFYTLLAFPLLVFSWEIERKSLIFATSFVAVLAVLTLGEEPLQLRELLGMPAAYDTTLPPVTESPGQVFWSRVTVGIILLVQMASFAYLTQQSNADVALALAQARQAGKAKGAFLANMSHEIRTPMNGMIGMLEVLENIGINERQAPTVGTIRNSAFALLRIIDDILDASKIEAGKLDIRQEPAEFLPIVEGVVQTVRPLADDTDVKLRLFIDPALPAWIVSDAGRLRQILLNLTSNALKFSSRQLTHRDGEVMIRITPNGKDKVCFRISDNGIGMDQSLKDRLFQPFSQGDNAGKLHIAGTGLGLVITKNLIELLGGTIAVDSATNEGTDILVTLPLVKAEGESRLADISGLDLICFTLGDININDGLRDILERSGAQTAFVNSIEALRGFTHKAYPIVLIPTDDTILADEVQRAATRLLPGCKVLRFSSDRTARFGSLSPNCYQVQIQPMLLSDLMRGIATLAGRDMPKHGQTTNQTAIPSTTLTQQNARILVVEDNEINRIVLSKQLDMLGFSHELALNGAEGLSRWQSGRFDLILTDCHMPVLDGFELTAKIRDTENVRNLSKIPIIAITANAMEGEAERCISAGMDGYLAKPIELNSLRQKLAEILPVA